MTRRRFLPYLGLVCLSVGLYLRSRETRQDIKVEYGHYDMTQPFVMELENYDNRYICNDCDMMIKTYKNSAQLIKKNGNVYVFDDIGCLLSWVKSEGLKDDEYQAFVFVKDIEAYIMAEDAWYIRDGSTPVGYGFEAFQMALEARRNSQLTSQAEGQFGVFQRKAGITDIYEWFEIKEFAFRGETVLHPMIKREVLEKR